MAELFSDYAEVFADETEVVLLEDAKQYALELAEEAIKAYKAQTEPKQKGNEMGKIVDSVIDETQLNAKIVAGEILLENIETLAEKVILNNLTWWQKLTLSNKRKEQLTTVGIYLLVQVIKNGAFGYKIQHPSIDYVSIASNKKIMQELVKLTGIDTNIIKTLLVKPTIQGA